MTETLARRRPTSGACRDAFRRPRPVRRGRRRVLLRPRRGEGDRHREPARGPPDDPLRRERVRQDVAPACRRRPRPARAGSRERGRAAGADAVCDLRVQRLARRPAASARRGDAGRRASRRSAARSCRRGSPASRSSTPSARWTERVRPLLVVLDQFEDYFLYHPDEDGEGTLRGRVPAAGQRAQPARELRALAPRGRLGEARPLRGPHPRPVRELRPCRAPRPQGRARGDRRARRRVEPPPAARRGAVRGRAGAGRGGDRGGRRRQAGAHRERRRRRPENGERRRGRGAVPPARPGAALARDGRGRRAHARPGPAGGARRRAADRREPPARGARQAHARRAGRRRRRLPLPRHPLEDEDRPPGLRPRRLDEAARAGGHGRAREALPRRERPHPPLRLPARRRDRGQLRALPRRPRRADPRLAEGVRAAAEQEAEAQRQRARPRGGSRASAPSLLALVAVFAGLARLGAEARAATPRARRRRRGRSRSLRPRTTSWRCAPRRVAAPEPGGRPGEQTPRRREAA